MDRDLQELIDPKVDWREVLREFVKVARGALRREDLFGRFGGEEFCVLLPETGVEGAANVAERIRAGTEAMCVRVAGMEIRCTVSIGIAGTEAQGRDLASLLRAADKSLYRAKHGGRNRVVGEVDAAD